MASSSERPSPLRQADARGIPTVEVAEGQVELQRFGQMLAVFRQDLATRPQSFRVQPSPPVVEAKEIPRDVQPLISSAINSVRFGVRAMEWDRERIVVEGDLTRRERQNEDAARLEHDLFARMNRPDYVVRGNIVKYDDRLETKNRNAALNLLFGKGKFAFEPSVDYERDAEVSEMGFNLRVESRGSGELVPNAHADTSALVAKIRKQFRFGLLILGSGASYGGQATRANGVHDTASRVVNRSVLVMLGRLYSLPWWRCVRGGEPDELVLAALREEWAMASPGARARILRDLLRKSGASVPASGEWDDGLREALRQYASRWGEPCDGDLANLYVRLHLSIPMPFEPLDMARDVAREIGGVTVQFVGFPTTQRDGVSHVLKECLPRKSDWVRNHQDEFTFHLQGSVAVDALVENLPREWNRFSGQRCKVEALDAHRVRVTNLSVAN